MDQDDRPVYDDRLYFTRGRSGYRPEPPSVNRTDVLLSLLALVIIGCVFGACVAWVHIP